MLEQKGLSRLLRHFSSSLVQCGMRVSVVVSVVALAALGVYRFVQKD